MPNQEKKIWSWRGSSDEVYELDISQVPGGETDFQTEFRSGTKPYIFWEEGVATPVEPLYKD